MKKQTPFFSKKRNIQHSALLGLCENSLKSMVTKIIFLLFLFFAKLLLSVNEVELEIEGMKRHVM
jgi:hypothetical protein